MSARPSEKRRRCGRDRRASRAAERRDDEKWMARGARAGRAGTPVAEPARRRRRREGRARSSAPGTTSAPARSTPRSPRCARPATRRAGRDALRHARALQPLGPHAAVHRGDPRREGRARGRRLPRPEPARRGRRRREAARGRAFEVDVGVPRGRGARAHRALDEVRDDRDALRVAEARRSRSTGASRRARAPRSGSPGPRRARASTCCAPSTTPSSIGIGTALADDPRLTVRDAPGQSPLRVVFDTKLRLPLGRAPGPDRARGPTWVVCTTDAPSSTEEALVERGVEVLRAPASAEGRIDPIAALRLLASRGIVAVMVEGGAELAGSVLAGARRRRAARLHRPHPARPARAARARSTGRARRPPPRRRASSIRSGRSAESTPTSGARCSIPPERPRRREPPGCASAQAARLDGSAR